MYHHLENDKENIDELIKSFYHYSTSLLKDFDKRNVALEVPDIKLSPLSKEGEGFTKSLELFTTKYEKYLSSSMGNRYFGFVTGGATPASLIGDFLTSLYDNNVANFGESCSSNITYETLKQLKELFELPDTFEGIFVTGATMSNFVGLATARQWFGEYYNIDIAKSGIKAVNEDLTIFSATAHSSVYKSLSMLGLGKNSLKSVLTNENSETIDINDLEKKLSEQNGVPCIVVANAGTVNTVGFDDLLQINQLKEKYNFWLHVDAAFGGFAKCSQEHKHLINGLEFADSITIDAHKWLNVPYDCAMHFTKHLSTQFKVFSNASSYLKGGFSPTNYVHLSPENSQRLRALPTWFSLNAYGKEGYSEIVKRNCSLAKELGSRIEESNDFILLHDVVLNGVCFTIKGENVTSESINKLIQFFIKDGRIFLTPTVYNNKAALRFSISNWQTTSKDINIAWEALNDSLMVLE